MTWLVGEWFERFAYITGILGGLRVYQDDAVVILLIVGGLSCFFGFRIYRMIFSILAFIGVTIISCLLLRDRTDWGSIVACFSVVGCIIAFQAYSWHRLGACILNGLICMSFAWLIVPAIWSVIIGGTIGIVSTLMFPVISLCVFTATWGGILLAEWINKPSIIVIFTFLSMVGVAVQLLMNQKQSVFTKVCPNQVTFWIEQHRRKEG